MKSVKMQRTALWLIVSALLPMSVFAQQQPFSQPYVHTLRTYVEGDETSFPLIELNSGGRVIVEFDILDSNIADLEYSLRHCNSDGTPSNLLPAEYANGFTINAITDYSPSVGTTVQYINYRIGFPNDDVQMLLSGCYQVDVFYTGRPDSLVARTMFMVCEQLAGIDVEILKPQTAVSERHSHDVRLSVDCSDLPVNDFFGELSVSVIQNGSPFNSLTDLKPKQIAGRELIYSYAGDMMISGGNEFRRLDMRYLRRAPVNYNQVDFHAPFFHITTPTDESRAFKPYFTETDQNGQYLIYAETVNKSFDDYYRAADYAYAHLTLASEPMLDGDVFVCGGFCNWRLDSTNMMRYNFQQHRYESDLLLKQGVYDYIYVCRTYTGQVDTERFEGSHSETGNSYLFLVFFRPVTGEYEQLVGVLEVKN